MTKSESKYQNTARRMEKALIVLLDKKSFSFISIKEVCHEANVNRSTFYLHYRNTYDLLEDAIKIVLSDFYRQFTDLHKEHTDYISDSYLTIYLEYVKSHQNIFRIFYKQDAPIDRMGILRSMYKFAIEDKMKENNVPESDREYIFMYYITGMSSIIGMWLERDCIDPVDHIKDLILRLTWKKAE